MYIIEGFVMQLKHFRNGTLSNIYTFSNLCYCCKLIDILRITIPVLVGFYYYYYFFIDKQPNILEKAKKPHVYRGYTEQPYTRLEKTKKEGKKKPHPPSSDRKPPQKA